MDSDVAVKLLESAVNKGNTLQSYLKDRQKVAHELGKALVENDIVRAATQNLTLEKAFRNALAIGVDSSRQVPWRILSTFYCPITSAIVHFNGLEGKGIYDSDCPCKFYEETNLTTEEFGRKVEEEMYRCEVSAIARISSSIDSYLGKQNNNRRILLMIDGPILDPPNKALYSGYVIERAQVVLACVEYKALVMGCVKSLEGRHFLSFLERHTEFSELANVAEGFGLDPQLIPFVFAGIRSIGPMLQTKPIEILDPDWLVKEYKSSGLSKVYRIYLTLERRGTPFGVDYLVDEKEDPEEVGDTVCNAIRAWGVPGLNAPLPVVSAHRRCNIRKGSSEYLYRQLLTRALSWEGGTDMLGPLSGGH